jgi:hypothetical protein
VFASLERVLQVALMWVLPGPQHVGVMSCSFVGHLTGTEASEPPATASLEANVTARTYLSRRPWGECLIHHDPAGGADMKEVPRCWAMLGSNQ